MKHALLISLILIGTTLFAHENNPVAAPGAQVVSGNARFTVLTDRLIRMEWAPEAQFEDRAMERP